MALGAARAAQEMATAKWTALAGDPAGWDGCDAAASSPAPERCAVLLALRDELEPDELEPDEQQLAQKPLEAQQQPPQQHRDDDRWEAQAKDEAVNSPPTTPCCSPPEGEALPDASEPTTAAGGSSGADRAEDAPADADTSGSASTEGASTQSRRKKRSDSGTWQLVDDGDRIACVMVTGRSSSSHSTSSDRGGKAAFGLEVEERWHSQLESLIEMGYGVKAAADALRAQKGDLIQAFKMLEQRR